MLGLLQPLEMSFLFSMIFLMGDSGNTVDPFSNNLLLYIPFSVVLNQIVTTHAPNYKQYFPRPLRKSGQPATWLCIFHDISQNLFPQNLPVSSHSVLSQNNMSQLLMTSSLVRILTFSHQHRSNKVLGHFIRGSAY